MKTIKYISFFFIVLGLLYFLGPRQNIKSIDHSIQMKTISLEQLELAINQTESCHQIKENNEARIVWFDPLKKQHTNFVLLYLHGFSASQYEGYPLHRSFARRYGCNMYLARLAAHGLQSENALLNMQPYDLYESAKEALSRALQLGNKVIIMSTSTGGTLSLQLAADFPELVHSLILYSPNIMIKDKTVQILTGPWGLQIARLFTGSDFRTIQNTPEEAKYWYSNYRVEGIIYLQALLDNIVSKETFAEIKRPAFVGYYYKDEENQDMVVEVEAIKEMFEQLGTPSGKKKMHAFPEAGAHVIACELTSGAVPDVKKETFLFAEEVLGLKQINP